MKILRVNTDSVELSISDDINVRIHRDGNYFHYMKPNTLNSRTDGPAEVIFAAREVNMCWMINGVAYNPNGPSVIDTQTNIVYTDENGFWSRIDGPAYIQFSRFEADYKTEWWINDNYVNDELRVWATEMDIDLENLTEDDKTLILLRFGNG